MSLLLAATSTVSTATVAPTNTATVAPAVSPPPRFLSVGTDGVFYPGVLIQGWFIASRGEATTSTFRLRRAELQAKGELTTWLNYGLVIDFAKVLEAPSTRALSALQDVTVTFKSKYVDATVGQFKIPVSWEGFNSSTKLLFPERDIVATTFGDKRDLGVRLAKKFEYVYYSVGLYNGTGQNLLDNNNSKDVGVRMELYPIEGLMIGGVGYMTVGKRQAEGARDRFEVDLRFERSIFLLQSEFIHGEDVGGNGVRTKGRGFYAAAGVKVFPEVQLVGRFGYLDPDISVDLQPSGSTIRDEMWHYEGCVNVFIYKQEVKAQLAASRFVYESRTAVTDVTLALQVAF